MDKKPDSLEYHLTLGSISEKFWLKFTWRYKYLLMNLKLNGIIHLMVRDNSGFEKILV
jgi:hypothetical protein